MLNIFIKAILYKKQKYNKLMSKVVDIISKVISNQYQYIIKDKTSQNV